MIVQFYESKGQQPCDFAVWLKVALFQHKSEITLRIRNIFTFCFTFCSTHIFVLFTPIDSPNTVLHGKRDSVFIKLSTNQKRQEIKPGKVNCSTKAIIYSYYVGIDCKLLWKNCVVSEWTRGLSMSHVRVEGDSVLGVSAGSPTPAEGSHRRLWVRKDNTFFAVP